MYICIYCIYTHTHDLPLLLRAIDDICTRIVTLTNITNFSDRTISSAAWCIASSPLKSSCKKYLPPPKAIWSVKRSINICTTYRRNLYIWKKRAASPAVPLRCSGSQCIAMCCSVLQCVAVRCRALQCVAVRCSALHFVAMCCSGFISEDCEHVAVCRSVSQCVAVCCSVLQVVALCGGVEQRIHFKARACVAARCGVACVAVCCSGRFPTECRASAVRRVFFCCSVLQCSVVWCSVAGCGSVWQCVAVANYLRSVEKCCSSYSSWSSVLQCVAACRSVSQRVALSCSVVQCCAVWLVADCCSLLQLVAVCRSGQSPAKCRVNRILLAQPSHPGKHSHRSAIQSFCTVPSTTSSLFCMFTNWHRTARHCKTLRFTATHCNTRQESQHPNAHMVAQGIFRLFIKPSS